MSIVIRVRRRPHFVNLTIMSTLQLRPLSRSVPNATRSKTVSSTCRSRIHTRGNTTKAAKAPANPSASQAQTQAEETLPWQEYLAIRKRKRRWETVSSPLEEPRLGGYGELMSVAL